MTVFDEGTASSSSSCCCQWIMPSLALHADIRSWMILLRTILMLALRTMIVVVVVRFVDYSCPSFFWLHRYCGYGPHQIVSHYHHAAFSRHEIPIAETHLYYSSCTPFWLCCHDPFSFPCPSLLLLLLLLLWCLSEMMMTNHCSYGMDMMVTTMEYYDSWHCCCPAADCCCCCWNDAPESYAHRQQEDVQQRHERFSSYQYHAWPSNDDDHPYSLIFVEDYVPSSFHHDHDDSTTLDHVGYYHHRVVLRLVVVDDIVT
mmetsp:Transcript_15329/g.43189  ORF Transcript_15329/g.43189 Transcript_15329/m.43189 type:complete len:258 (-) Transcript_15329:278-1051(-)